MSQIDQDLLRDGVAYADRWVSYQQERRDIPGIVVAIRHEDQLLLARGYGYADLERGIRMTAQHIFRVASHSKTFTATAIMQLVEQEKLRLDDRLAAYIPWLQHVDGLSAVTIRGALNHSSGMVRDGHAADYWQLERPFPDDAELQRLVEEGGAVLAANEQFKYSNMAYSLLGLVIAAASGLPYDAYVRRHIVERLGLKDTGPETDDHARARLATGYTVRRLGLPRRPIPDVSTGAMAAATGFYATAEDLCRYAAAHFLGNDALLSDASKREMQQPYWQVAAAEEHYGLGFNVLEIGGRRLVGHGGGFPGHATRTMIDPRDRLAIVVLTNEIGGPAAMLGRGIMKIIDFALRQPRAAITGANARFAGRFVNLWSVTDVAAFGETLVALSPEEEDPVKCPTQLTREGDETLRVGATNGYGAPGELIPYSRDAAGHATRIVIGGMRAYPPEEFRLRQMESGVQARQ